MQNEPSDAAQARLSTHTKLMTVDGRLFTVMLQRDQSDVLAVVLQTWCGLTDEQLRAVLTTPSDEQTQALFDSIDEAGFADFIAQVGFAALIEQSETPE